MQLKPKKVVIQVKRACFKEDNEESSPRRASQEELKYVLAMLEDLNYGPSGSRFTFEKLIGFLLWLMVQLLTSSPREEGATAGLARAVKWERKATDYVYFSPLRCSLHCKVKKRR